MDINSLQGSAAYANVPNANPPVENTTARDQNLETPEAPLTTETTSDPKKAFEVTITQEAQDRLNSERAAAEASAQQASEQVAPAQAEPAEDQKDQNNPPAQGSGPIVNIVA